MRQRTIRHLRRATRARFTFCLFSVFRHAGGNLHLADETSTAGEVLEPGATLTGNLDPLPGGYGRVADNAGYRHDDDLRADDARELYVGL